MSRSHTQSLFVSVAPGVFLGQFPYVTAPRKLLQFKDAKKTQIDLATSKFIVVGGVKRIVQGREAWLNLQARWSTLSGPEVKELLDYGRKEDTAHQIRGVSRIAGNSQGAGSEVAVIVGLDKNKAGLALADKYFCNYSVTNLVGRGENQVAVTHGPSFMMNMDVARLVSGELVFPEFEKETAIPGRNGGMDLDNPTFQQLVAYFDATGELLPRTSQNNFNQQMAAQVVGMPQPRQNGYQGGYRPMNNGYQQVQNWAQNQVRNVQANDFGDQPDF